MLGNYLKLAFRSLLHNRLYSFINIAGLTVGLAAGILVLLLIHDELRFDKFHTNLPNLHLILQNQTQGGVTYTFEALPGPLAAALRAEIPEVKRAFRFSWRGQQLLALGEKSTFEQGYYAEPDFFNSMSFEALAGNPVAALQDAGSLVITERTARKFFDSPADALGKVLRHNNLRDLKVGAVIRDLPTTSTLKFDVALPFHIFEQMNSDWVNSNWGNNSLPTWVELQPGCDLAALNKKLENFVQAKNPDAAAHILAYPLSEWHLRNKFKEGKQSGGRITMVWLMGIIGAFVLLIACANFMNLATARSERRARKVGVRKVAGAQRSLIIGQFLAEAMLMTFIGLVLSVLLALAMLPAFNRLAEKSLSLDISNWPIWGSILLLGLLTGLIAGSYPALYLSKFQPVQVLRGNSPLSGGRGGAWLRKGLVAFQFFITTMLIISTIVVTRQLDHAQNRPLGYDPENLIDIPARGDMGSKYESLRNELSQISGVKSVSAADDNLVQFGSNTSGIQWPGKTDDQDFLISITSVRLDWVRTAGLKIVEGRDFNPSSPGDTMCCLLNETAVRMMGLGDKAIGTVLRHDTALTVIGVVQDFVFNDPTSKPDPMVVSLGTHPMNHFFVRFQNDDRWRETLAQVEQAAKRINPAYPFEFRFTKDEYQKGLMGVRSTSQMGYIFGSIAVFISCLGLFGLSAFVAERRKKEVGVRKVLGASVANVWAHISSEFMRPVLLAFVLAAPLAGFAMSKLLATMEYRIELSWWMFALAGLLTAVIALLTVSFQSVKAALANPVQSLRSE